MNKESNYAKGTVCHDYLFYISFFIVYHMILKNLNPLEKLPEKPFFKIEEIEEAELEAKKELGFEVNYSNFNEQTGCLTWNLYNFNLGNPYFALARGTNLVKPYFFLEFYTEVYKAFNVIEFLTAENLKPENPYSIGLVEFDENNRNYAGVFYVPEGHKLSLMECGFAPDNLPNFYMLIPVKYKSTENYLVEYNYMEVVDYTLQTGILVPNAPFPLYEQRVAKFKINVNDYWINPRKFVRMGWLSSLIFKHL